jgi:hypothetical protein
MRKYGVYISRETSSCNATMLAFIFGPTFY